MDFPINNAFWSFWKVSWPTPFHHAHAIRFIWGKKKPNQTQKPTSKEIVPLSLTAGASTSLAVRGGAGKPGMLPLPALFVQEQWPTF